MSTTSDRQQAPHVIPIIEKEFTDFDTEAKDFLAGNQDEKKFIGFRLKQGVYGQRQAARQMVRVKLPFGGVTPQQLEGFAQVAERFAPLGKAERSNSVQEKSKGWLSTLCVRCELGCMGVSATEESTSCDWILNRRTAYSVRLLVPEVTFMLRSTSSSLTTTSSLSSGRESGLLNAAVLLLV